MDDAAAVRGVEPIGDLGDDLDRQLRRQRPGLRRDEPAERAAVEVVHHHEPRPAVGQLAEVVDGDQVAVLERRRGARLVDEALDDLRVLRPLVVQHLHRAQLVEHDVLG